MAETVVVTGGAGFIGSHVVDKLLAVGYRVVVIDDLSTGRKANLPDEVELHEVDIRSSEIAPLMKELAPDSVIHLAAQIDVRRSLKEPKLDADINIMGGLNVVTAAMAAGCSHVVFASSAATYGVPQAIPISEDHSQQPADHYGVSKLAFEHYLRVFREVNGLQTATLRFANVYGPRQTVKGEAGVVAIFLKKLLNGQAPTIHGDGEQTRDYVYVGDVAAMTVRAVQKKLLGTFNVSTGVETTVNDIAARLQRLVASEVAPEHGPPVPNENRRCSLSPVRTQSETGWQPQVGLEEGLRATYEYAKDDPAFQS
jgi:UDP-glucose 4-epimerase